MTKKGMLKRIKGVLKMIGANTPFAIVIGSIVVTVSSLCKVSAIDHELKTKYYGSERVDNAIEERLEEVKENVLSGKVTFEEGINEHGRITSEEYRKEVQDELFENDSEYAILKRDRDDADKVLCISFMSDLGMTGLLLSFNPLLERVVDSAKDDFIKARKIDNNYSCNLDEDEQAM